MMNAKTIFPVSLGAVITATAMFAAAAAVGFKFADKGSNLGEYFDQISQFVAEDDTEKAVKYTHQLIAAYDKHIAEIKKEARADDKSAKGKQADNRLAGTYSTRQLLELVRGGVLLNARKMPKNDWLSLYENELNANPDEADRIVGRLFGLPRNIFSTEMIEMLLDGNIPQKSRGRLEKHLFDKKFPKDKKADTIWVDFYQELIVQSADIKTKKKLLNQYVLALDKRGKHNSVNRALDNIIKLRADTELGLEAVRLRLADVKEGPGRDKLLVQIIDEHPDTVVSFALADHYVTSLARQNRCEDAIQALDGEKCFDAALTHQQRIETIKGLVQRMCELSPQPIGNLRGKASNKKTETQMLTPSVIYAGLADDFQKKSRCKLSAAMSFAAMEEKNALPLNLSTAKPIRSVADIGIDIDKSNTESQVVQYLAARAYYAVGNDKSAKKLLESLVDESVPQDIRSYALYLKGLTAAARKKNEDATQWAQKAHKIAPDSPVINTFIASQKRLAKPPKKTEKVAP
ncbi:MAG: hypothetical protein DRP52_01535 [Planctomycetota bacterium]|nr:MAG: hypothetical protein DRP52_01535 [Planctomycetota bacterium]